MLDLQFSTKFRLAGDDVNDSHIYPVAQRYSPVIGNFSDFARSNSTIIAMKLPTQMTTVTPNYKAAYFCARLVRILIRRVIYCFGWLA